MAGASPTGEVTLADVANEAGVSVSTASRVLNQSASRIAISPRTAAKVRGAADRLGYVPHAAARMLRTGRSRTLGVLGAHPAFFASRGSFVGEIMHGLMQGGVEAGYHVTLLTGWEHLAEGNDFHADLGSADGLLVLNRDLYQHPAHLEALRRCRLPTVFALEYPDDPDAFWTAPDDEQGGRLAVEALAAAGHRRIAFVRSAIYPGIFGRRQRGWRTGLAQAGLEPGPILHLDRAEDALGLVDAGATAYVCANETIAGWCRDALGDRSVILAFSHSAHPREPQIEHDLADTIRAAVAQLIDRIDGHSPVQHQIRPYRLRGTIPRAS